MELELDHLEGRRVTVAHQVADKPAIFVDEFRALSIAHTRRLHDRAVGGLPLRDEPRHRIDKRDEAMLVDRNAPTTRARHYVAERRFRKRLFNRAWRGGSGVGHTTNLAKTVRPRAK